MSFGLHEVPFASSRPWSAMVLVAVGLTVVLAGCGDPPGSEVADAGTLDASGAISPRDGGDTDAGRGQDDGSWDAGESVDGAAASSSGSDGGVDAASLPDWVGGVSLSGAEFNGRQIPGRYGFDYIYPPSEDAQYFIDAGMRVLRIPFRWGRIQRELEGPLAAEELERLRALVTYITDQGVYAILDVHDYAKRDGQTVGSAGLPNAVLADLWRRLAQEFRGDDHVWFGLMNEPNDIPTSQWLSAANASIAAIRATGATNLVLVPGARWTGAHSWYEGSESNADVMGGVIDPADNYVYELHQYLDVDSSGTHHYDCASPTIGSARLAAVTEWLRAQGRRGFLGEVGAGDDPVCAAAMDDMLQFMRTNQDVWMGFTWWAAGPWWGDYPYSIQPREDGSPAPQEAWLAPHL